MRAELARCYADAKANPEDAVQYQRQAQMLTKMYEDATGESLAESRRRLIDPLVLLATESILDLNEKQLGEVESAISRIDALDEKKKLVGSA